MQRVCRYRIEVRVEAIDRLGQHRVAEAVNRVGELGDDRRVNGGVIAGRRQELVHLGLNSAGELLEHQVLVLHLGAELGSLEQPLAVPLQGVDRGLGGRERARRGAGHQPGRQFGQVARGQQGALGLFHQAVVLGVEHVMHGGQADVFVDPAVTGYEVGIQQFVVVGARRRRSADVDDGVGVCRQATGGVCAVGDVDQELVACADRVGQVDGGQRVAFHQEVVGGADQAVRPFHHHLREAVGPLDEVAIGVGGQQWHIEHIGVGQVDPEDVAGLRLDHRPGSHATDFHVVGGAEIAIGAQVAIGDQCTGSHGFAVGVQLIGAQEHLVRGMRAVGLVLVDEGRGGVLVQPGAAKLGGAGQDHEVGRAVVHEAWIVRLQRDEDDVVAALGHQVQTMVEELSEEGHPGIEGRGQPGVRRSVRNVQGRGVVSGSEQAIEAGADHCGRTRGLCGGGHGRRVVVGHVDQQVADGARLAVDHRAGGLGIGGPRLRWAEGRVEQAREDIVCGAELGLAGEQVVEGAVDGAQTERHLHVGQ
ncbi:hypothetical protein D3C87_878710 [compost metagenome]